LKQSNQQSVRTVKVKNLMLSKIHVASKV